MFEKGQSGNPSGRPKLPEDIRSAINAGREQIARELTEIENMTVEELKLIDMEKTTMLRRVIIKAYVDNDHQAIKTYQDRVYGKAKETIDIEHSGNISTGFSILGVNADTDSRKD